MAKIKDVARKARMSYAVCDEAMCDAGAIIVDGPITRLVGAVRVTDWTEECENGHRIEFRERFDDWH